MKNNENKLIHTSGLVDPVHMFMKLWSMSIMIIIVVCDKKVGVDHLMEQGLDQILPRPQLQQGNRNPFTTSMILSQTKIKTLLF